MGKPMLPRDERREHYAQLLNLKLLRPVHLRRLLTQSFMDVLDKCADDSARRVLVGRGRRAGGAA